MKSPDSPQQATDIGAFMGMMDVVDLTRRRDRAVQEQLSVEDQKKDIAKKLRETYKTMGVEVTERQVTSAIENHYARKWEFVPPRDGLGTTLGHLYVNRGRITRYILLPIAAGLALTGAGVVTVSAIDRAAQRAAEHGIEARVESLYTQRSSLEKEFAKVSNAPHVNELPESERQQLTSNVALGKARLTETSFFFDTFCPKGNAESAVTQSNYQGVGKDAARVESTLHAAEDSLTLSKGIIKTQESFIVLKNNLDNLASQVKNALPPAPLEKRADELYQNGLVSIEHRQLTEAQKAQMSLSGVLKDVNDFGQLVDSAERIYADAKGIVREDAAHETLEGLESRIIGYVTAADVANLRTSLGEMESLRDGLKQEYRIEVLNRPGIRTGLWRQYDNNPPRNRSDEDPQGKRFYIVVHAVDKNGKEYDIKNIKLAI